MEFLYSFHTDIGIRKDTNQDSLLIREAKTKAGRILLAILCDGMGGLAKGEVASATIIKEFSKWFESELPSLLTQEDYISEIEYRWGRLIKSQNIAIAEYGKKQHIQLGSTITAMLFFADGNYLIGHVGDSRAYRITNSDIEVLTEDQTVVALAVKEGRMTPEQAKTDPRRNVLLQCVGASRVVEPVFIKGKYSVDECYMLCSDGFRHEVTPEEIQKAFSPINNNSKEEIKQNIVELVELNKEREEVDNITSLLVKII